MARAIQWHCIGHRFNSDTLQNKIKIKGVVVNLKDIDKEVEMINEWSNHRSILEERLDKLKRSKKGKIKKLIKVKQLKEKE